MLGGMAGDEEREIRIAVAEGILTGVEAEAFRAEAERAEQGVLERLRAEGRISGATFASLRARLDEQAKDERALEHGDTWNQGAARAASSGELVESGSFPVPGWDRYEPIRLLGQGGMGRVFLAKDLRLDRNVAIKFVRDEDPELSHRIVAEARAQARVDDDRVCKVFEVGEVRGRVYIAMQHIDGRPLSDLAGELTVEQKVIVMRGAALGVAEAHRVGLIHRDLKPSNIMVERRADGELRPYVMDFGLARDWAEGTTMTGTVLGTPQYMSPEQASGEVKQLDRRTDVYSLGATLYALLAGKPPIEGSNPLVVLTRVALDEPPRLRAVDPDIPADLDAIAMKCLEKERAARYDSARALADDLGRFLAGEPVAARSAAGLGYRARKWLRRRARWVAAGAAALVLVAVALGFVLHERRQAERREALARRFTERVERIESMARYSALAPLHDIRQDRAQLRRAMDELADEVRAGGDLAAGPGRYALGRGHLALGDDERAAAELAAAWEGGYREPRVAYALALAEGRLYQRALREIERLPKEQRETQRGAIERRYRDPALAHLRASEGADVPSLDYVAAMVAYFEQRFDDALRHLDAIDREAAGLAWFYEAPLLRGEILRARAGSYRGTATAQTAADLDAGRRALVAAAAIGRSDPAVHIALGALESMALRVEIYGRGEVAAPFERGVDAAGRALAILPDDVAALDLRGGLLRQLAEHRGNRGEDATELLTRAVTDGRRAVELAPARREGKLALADSYRYWGQFRHGRSEDPTEQLGKAIEIASTIAPGDREYEYHNLVGLTHMAWADYQDQTGQGSDHHRSLAIDAYTSAIRIDGQRSVAWLNLGINYYHRASQPRSRDADADLSRALEAFERGHALVPRSFVPSFYQGEVFARIAQRKQERGLDPEPDRARAIEMYRRGLAINPKLPHFHNGISIVQVQQAKDETSRGRDPTPLLDQAQAAAAQAIAVAPEQGHGYNNLGDALAHRAAYERARGRDPRPIAREAASAFAQALERIPAHVTSLLNLASLHLLVAAYELDRALDPQESLALARRNIDRALARDPTSAEAKGLLAEASALEARWRARGRTRTDGASSGSAQPARGPDPTP